MDKSQVNQISFKVNATLVEFINHIHKVQFRNQREKNMNVRK
jgi:hypothetical protein